MTLILIWILRVIVVLFLLRLLLRAIFPRGIGAPAGARPRAVRRERAGGELVRDAQCGTYIPKSKALVLGSGDTAHYFCSTACRDKYLSAGASAKNRQASA